jgi:DNA-directed RNA polymerase specialized sigma24 family protein
MSTSRLRQLDLPAVIEGCCQETARFRAGQPGEEGHCFELFRRAIEKDDQEAWSALHAQYYRMIAQWIGGHPAGDELIESTFEKFWRTMRGVRLSRRFKHVGALLAYLRKCAFSVRFDLDRREQRDRRMTPNEAVTAYADDVEDLVLANIARDALQDSVRRWLAEHIQDTQEKQVVFLSYELDLPPAEIARRFPEQFADAKEVRKIKERVVKRLRRADGLRELLKP